MDIDAENLSATELRLGPPGTSSGDSDNNRPTNKRALELDDTTTTATRSSAASETVGDDHDTAAPAKAQVVGWPPVRSYRKNNTVLLLQQQKKASGSEQQQQQQPGGGLYVKVSMDGAPYLRKLDLTMYKGYRELRDALDALFTKSLSTASAADRNRYAVAYEDKDGDLMLVGDVPWDMFISSCKKLRIMKGSEAR